MTDLDLTPYIRQSLIGVPNGIAGLDSDGNLIGSYGISSVGVWLTSCGPENMGDNSNNGGGFFLGGGQPADVWPNDLTTFLVWPAGSSGPNSTNFGFSWVINITEADTSVCLLPVFDAPAFTGTSLLVTAQIGALDLATGAVGLWTMGPKFFTSGLSYQTLNSDFSLVFQNGSEFTLTGGTGESGNGLVTSTTSSFIGSVYGTIDYSGIVFT